MISKQDLQNRIEEYLKDSDYELMTLSISGENDIVVEIDRLEGVDVDFCAALNRYLVEQLGDEDYSLEVGSVSLTAPFKTKMQFEKNLGHDVEIMISAKDKGQSTKYKGLLVSVDEDTFSVDVVEKVNSRKQTVTYTWHYDEPIYVKYDLKI